MTITTIIRVICGIILLVNLWLIGKYNIQGMLVLILTIGLVLFFEYFIIEYIPLEKLSEKELTSKIKKKTKILIYKDINKIQQSSKYIKNCYFIAAAIVYIPLFLSNELTHNFISSLFIWIASSLFLGALFQAMLFLYIYFKNRNKVADVYQHYAPISKNRDELINIVRALDLKNKAP
ncbi:hypothetical protein [Acinetobacter sp. MB5]|uniref:hypothetical protein n=1 Tax=Acinetobacter sp. MB5 TaxID=2069438 RepID=UPI000DD0CF0D|nr:hypothetical protein [Acinetobacter sp. MB5]